MTWMPQHEWYASLPTFLASSAALITDPTGDVLLVKPNYRPWWNLPGGVLEADEAPDAAARREVHEELGLELRIGRLLVVSWAPPTPERQGWFGFVFDGGVLTDPSHVRLQAEELDAFEFVTPEEAKVRLNDTVGARVAAALAVREGSTTAYLRHDP